MVELLTVPRVRTDPWGVWDRFLATHDDAGFHQSSWWAAAHHDPQARAFGVLVREDGILHGGGIFLREAKGDGLASYRIVDGPVLPAEPQVAACVFRALLALLQQRRRREEALITHLRLEPRWRDLPEFVLPFGPVTSGAPRTVASIDLVASETTLLAKMTPETRGQIALGRRLGLQVSEDASDRGIEDLLRLSDVDAFRTPEAVQLLPLLRQPGHGGIFFAEDGGTRLAGAAVVTFGGRATLLLAGAGGATAQGLAPTFLQFEIMRRMKARHGNRYDLVTTGDLHGLLAGLGGESQRLVGPLDIVFDQVSYASLAGRPPGGGR